ncbi:alpha/beta hydrolase [Flavobacteriaceae bacterium LMO-SS05]
MKSQIVFVLILLLLSVKINAQSTASKQVSSFTIEAPQLESQKTIWMYLPKGYQNSNKPYPVIYMHDAQNLFDAETSFVGEWKIDEFLDTLLNNDEAIVIGIEHGGEKRIDELTPFHNDKYGGGQADDYLNFIIKTLKPYIDSNYRALSNTEDTIIWGSSLGGLISLYALIKYPETFGKAGVFSPSIWINKNELFKFVKNATIDPDKRFYFLIGSEEGETVEAASTMVSDQHDMVQLLKDKGILDNHIMDIVIPNGHHNETLWSTNFPDAYDWLIKN